MLPAHIQNIWWEHEPTWAPPGLFVFIDEEGRPVATWNSRTKQGAWCEGPEPTWGLHVVVPPMSWNAIGARVIWLESWTQKVLPMS